MKYQGQLDYADARELRSCNKQHYRLAHWPIWIAIFFLAPGASTFALFDYGLGTWNSIWLLFVLAATGVAGWYGRLPGTERQPYILRFDEDRPNPLYRRVCYAFAWNAIISFATLNMCGLLVAAATGRGYMEQIYRLGYPPLCGLVLLLGVLGKLPRVGTSTRAEGTERRHFYGAVWAVTLAQVMLLAAWKLQWAPEIVNHVKLLVFATSLALGALATAKGLLPRTRPIVPGQMIVAD